MILRRVIPQQAQRADIRPRRIARRRGADVPSLPFCDTQSMFGFFATCSGVLSPRSGIGVSAAPSGMMRAYFIASFSLWLSCDTS